MVFIISPRRGMQMTFFTSGSSIKSSLVSLLLLVVLVAPIVRGVFGFQPYLPIFFVMVVFSFLLLFLGYCKGLSFYLFFLLFSLAFVFVVLTKFEDSLTLYFSVLNLLNLIIGYWLARQDSQKILYFSIFVLILYYALFLCLGLIYGYAPDDINNFFKNSSRNAVSAAALFFQILYSTSHYRVSGKLPLLTPIITFVISFLAYGRSGMFFSFLFVIWSFSSRFWTTKTSYKIVVIFVGLSIGVLGVKNFDLIEYYLFSQTNFTLGFESPRSLMLKAYIEELDFFSFFYGVDLSSIPIIKDFNNNPHNSVLLGHAMFGFFHIIFLISCAIMFLVSKRFSKKLMVYSILALVFFARSLTDIVALPGVYDFIFFYIFFIAMSGFKASNVNDLGKDNKVGKCERIHDSEYSL